MAASDSVNVAVVPPTPTFDINTYRPFGEEVTRTIDRILSEEASLQESKEEEWPVYTGSEKYSLSPSILSSRSASLGQQSPYFPRPSPTNKPKRTPRKRPVANRTITMMNFSDDSDEEICTTPSADPPEAGPVDGANDGKRKSHPASRVKHTKAKKERLPLETSMENTSQQDSDLEEEELIFSSLVPSQRDQLIQTIGKHELLRHPYAMTRSVRQKFEGDLRKLAASAGLSKPLIQRLIRYVRKNYFEPTGGCEGSPTNPPKDKTGPAVVNEHIEDKGTKSNIDTYSRKRRRHSSELATPRKAKKKSIPPTTTVDPETAVETIAHPETPPGLFHRTGTRKSPRGKYVPVFNDTPVIENSPAPKHFLAAKSSPVSQRGDSRKISPVRNSVSKLHNRIQRQVDEAEPSHEVSRPRSKSQTPNSQSEKKKRQQKRLSEKHRGVEIPRNPMSMLTHRTSKKIVRRRSLITFGQSTSGNRAKNKKKQKRRKSEPQPNIATDDSSKENREDISKPTAISQPLPLPRPKTPERQILQSPNSQSHLRTPSSPRKSPFAPLSPDPALWDMDF